MSEPIALPIAGMTKIPGHFDIPMMQGAFVSCLFWAADKKEFREQFKADTGHDLDRALCGRGISAMVDKATGYAQTVVAAFGDWVVVNVWGEEGAPESDDEP